MTGFIWFLPVGRGSTPWRSSKHDVVFVSSSYVRAGESASLQAQGCVCRHQERKLINLKCIYMKANVSKKAKVINEVWKAILIGGAIALAIGAWIYNPGHLITAGIIFAAGLETKIVNEESDDII